MEDATAGPPRSSAYAARSKHDPRPGPHRRDHRRQAPGLHLRRRRRNTHRAHPARRNHPSRRLPRRQLPAHPITSKAHELTTATATAQRALPHDLGSEEALIGAVLLSRDARDATIGTLAPDAFYKRSHAHIWAAITTLHETAAPVDTVTVAEQLVRDGLLEDAGGDQALVALQSATPATSSAARYAAIVRSRAELRNVIYEATEAVNAAYQLDTTSARRHTETAADILDIAITDHAPRHIDDVLADWIEEDQRRTAGDITCIPTGFYDLDRILGGGLRPGQLCVAAGRTSMGKSAFGGQLALHAAKAGLVTLVCSAEMAALELADRWISATSRVNATSVRTGTITPKDWPRVHGAIGELSCWPLWIDDRDDLTVANIRAAARSLPTMPQLLVVDYIQLLKGTGALRNDNRQAEVAEISSGLKRLARRLEIPIVALAQLNRAPEARSDKRPQLVDLRESGSIENDADVVIGLYRDEYYHRDTKDPGVLEAIVLKQRSGPRTTVRLHFAGEINAIFNLDNHQQEAGF